MTPGSLIASILVLAIVIFVHEMGHFLVAKWCKVEVKTFSMGFGPTIFARQIGETVYRLALIPLGGYVRMAGSDEAGEDPEDAASDPSRGFAAKSLWQRAAIVAAGPAINFVLAVVVLTAAAWVYGSPTLSDKPLVGAVVAGLPAESAGLKAGETVTAVDGTPIATWDAFLDSVMGSEGRALQLTVLDETGATREVELTPKLQERRDAFGEVVDEAWQIGIQRAQESIPVGAFEAVQVGARQTWAFSSMIGGTLVRLFQGRVSPNDLGGPILIVQEASRQAQTGLQPLVFFLALISVNLGILNLLPIPVLDGGHLLFMGYEAVRGRPLPLRVREMALQAGVVFIGALMIFVVFNDILRIVVG
jgi:regulator of sigma E protease